MEKMMAALQALAPLSEGLTEQLCRIVSSRRYLKRETLLRASRICPAIWYIEKGLVGHFYEKSGRTLCSGFLLENNFVLPIVSFFPQRPSAESIVALEDTHTHLITHEQLLALLARYPEFNLPIRLLVQHSYQAAAERLQAFHHQTPVEKYRYLIMHRPELILRVSNTHLASYMGMTIETLSRIKGRI